MDKFEKNKVCAYCGNEMDATYRSKKFCSDKCRVYFNRENKRNNVDVFPQSAVDEILNLAADPKLAEERKKKQWYLPIQENDIEENISDAKPKTYNELLGDAMTANSIDECKRIVAESLKLNLPAWQISNIEKASKQRSAHPDLN